jgi:SAM-dependent methyltransferase
MIKQIDAENKGIEDVSNDRSLTHRGYVHHSGFDFVPDNRGEFCKFIQAMIPQKEDLVVVEFGCGSGVLVQCLPEDCLYIGLDGNIEGGPFIKELDNPKKLHIPVDLTKDFELSPPVLADIVMSFDFFEHINEEHINKVISHFDRLLKPGGRFISLIDTIPLDEHVTIRPIEWWDSVFYSQTKWKPLCVGCASYNADDPSWQLFIQYHPPFWSGNINHQMLFVYEKPEDV